MADPTPARRLGDRIHAARNARGWSTQRLAGEAGISTQPIQSLEHGRECEFSNAARIAAALGIPLDEPEASHD